MATGYINQPLVGFDRGGAGSFELAPLPQDERGLDYEWEGVEGPWEFVNPNPISQSYGGFRQFSFIDDFYFRVYLLPQVLDFGAIVTDITRDVTVWNAYFDPVELESITANIGEEVTQTGFPLPYSIPALSLRSWSFSVTTDGPPTLDESFTWVFSTGETFELPVTGTRSVLWPFLPNWNDTFAITREFDTEILTSRNGTEQRIANREFPRKTMDFLVTISGKEKMREYRRLMTFWQSRPFIVADISRNVATETELLSGDATVTVSDGAATWLAQEDRAVVLASGDMIGLRVIDSIDDSNDQLTFKDTDGVDWPVGTKIYAGVVANLTDERRLARQTNTLLNGRVTFNIMPGTEIIERPPVAPVMFNDRELFMVKPNWGDTPENTDRHTTEYVDYGVGRLQRLSPIENATRLWTMNYVGRDAEDIQELIDVFERAKGRQGEFYMPTWEFDLETEFAIPENTLGLRVPGIDIYNAYRDDGTSRAVMVELHDGTRVFRLVNEITDIEDENGHDTLINMTETWDFNIEPEDINMICWVKVWRFATDDLTAEFLTNSVAQLQMSLQTLEDLPPESEEGSNSP